MYQISLDLCISILKRILFESSNNHKNKKTESEVRAPPAFPTRTQAYKLELIKISLTNLEKNDISPAMEFILSRMELVLHELSSVQTNMVAKRRKYKDSFFSYFFPPPQCLVEKMHCNKLYTFLLYMHADLNGERLSNKLNV